MADGKEHKNTHEEIDNDTNSQSPPVNNDQASPSATPEPSSKDKSKGEEGDASGSDNGKNRDESASESTSPAPEASSSTSTPPVQQNQWQAVWAPQYNAYYFYNSVTQETTWVNPLQSDAASSVASTSTSADADASGSSQQQETQEGESESPEAGPSTGYGTAAGRMSEFASQKAALEAAALAQGIDPALAHLDPSLLAPSVPGGSFSAGLPTFQAKFNNRTGQFTAMNSRTPGHLSEYERAKRMSEFYFDVNQWEQQLAEQGGSIQGEEDVEGGKKRKRPTKKDLERFKEQKKAKKIAKTAWLRS